MDEGEAAAAAGVLAGKTLQVAEESWPVHGNSNPDVEWILGESWVRDRSGSAQVQSPSSAPVGPVGLRKPVRRVSLGRNMGHVSNPDQGAALLVEARTSLHPPRMTEMSGDRLLLPAARRQPCPYQLCPTDPHSLLMCPNCGSDQDSTVC